MRIATWNVRTLRTGLSNTSGGFSNAQNLRKTAIIDTELQRLHVDITALQETRLLEEGSLREANYTFFWKGKDAGAVHEHGVGFAVRNDLLSSIETPVGVSERIMILRANTNCGFATFISAYAPTLTSSEDAKSQFYEKLSLTVRQVNPSDRLYILGDFNARVGQDNAGWPDSIGTHGVGKLNENGQRLLEFCSNFLLCVTNTYYRGKIKHKVSWKHPRSGHWHQLDLILARKKELSGILHTRSYHSADCDTDHSLVVSRITIKLKKIHSAKPSGLNKIDLYKVKDHDRVQKFAEIVKSETSTWAESATANEEWLKVKDLLTNVAGKTFGCHKVKCQDWFAKNIEHLQPLLESKRKAALNHRLNPSTNSQKELSRAKAALQRNVRHFANKYWTELCEHIQICADLGDIGGVYAGIKQALGPVTRKTAFLKDQDGTIITNSDRQLDRWVQHYTGLYSQPADISPEAIQLMPKLDTWTELDNPPTISEFQAAVSQLKNGKSPGGDGTLPELVKLNCISSTLYNLLCKCWEVGHVPQDMRDANIVTLYKGKGDRGDCNNYRGISLLSIVGKLFARAILPKLHKLADRIYPESQCGFRSGRSTVDMIFTLRQLQEKAREQNTPLYIAFVDLNKAFDTVSRDGLYHALESIGCPPKLLNLVKSFHENMRGSVKYDGKTSEPFQVRRGVRQGCVLAPTLFGIYFSILLSAAFGNDQQGIHFHTRNDGKLYNPALLRSKRYREDHFVDSLLFADDAAFVAGSNSELQDMLSKFSKSCSLFSMTINVRKTVVLAQGTQEIPAVFLNDDLLNVVDRFCYLGSTITNSLSLDAEISIRIGKAATMFGKLRDRVWQNKHLTTKTKMIVYQACVLSTLLYSAETWTSYAKQESRLNSFHMRCLRNILGITWKDRVTNERVLEIAQLHSLTAILKQRRLRWLGHVHRMETTRLPRRVMLGALANGKRGVGRPMLRFKDCTKRDMHSFNINHQGWEKIADDRPQWRKCITDGRKVHDAAWFSKLNVKHTKRHVPATSPPTSFLCSTCGRRCRSRIGLHSHQKACLRRHCLNRLP